jgi:hypothetical protein
MAICFAGSCAGALVRPTASSPLSTCGLTPRFRLAAPRCVSAARLYTGAANLRCFNDTKRRGGDSDDAGDDDYTFDPNSDENDDYETVMLNDPATGRTLSCVVENSVDIGGITYYVCCPEDDVVTFASERGDDGLVGIEDEAIVGAMFATAAAVLSEDHIVLKRTAFLMTADDSDADIMDGEDEEDDEFYDDDEADEEEEEFGASDDDEDEGSESVMVIGEFCHAGQDYLVVKPEGPILLVARDSPDGESLVVPDNDELDRVTPLIEEYLETKQDLADATAE